MRLLTLVIMLLLTGVLGMAAQSNVDAFFSKYKDNDNFTQINISPKMFQMMANLDQDDEESQDVIEVIAGLQGLRILTTDSAPDQYYKEFNASFDSSEYEELMTVKENDQNIVFLVKDSNGGNTVNELLLVVGGATEFVLMSFEGEIPLDKIGKLANGLNISGAEHLDKLKK